MAKEKINRMEKAMTKVKQDGMALMSIELGPDLTPLSDPKTTAAIMLQEHIQALREMIAEKYSIKLPDVKAVNNVHLEPKEYCIKMNGVEISREIISIKIIGKTITEFEKLEIFASALFFQLREILAKTALKNDS